MGGIIMRPVTNIKDLKPGERIVTLTKGEPQVYEFLMIHPYDSNYIICLNNLSMAAMVYVPDVFGDLFTEVSAKDIILYRKKYYQKQIKMLEKALK